MSLSLTEIQTNVKRRVRADKASPTLANLNDASITQWSNECFMEVVSILKGSHDHFEGLLQKDKALTGAGGTMSIPADLAYPSLVTIDGVAVKPLTMDEFTMLDSSNFIRKATARAPAATLANNKIYVKPTTATTVTLSYLKRHAELSAGTDTTDFSDLADQILVELVCEKLYDFREKPDLAAKARRRALELGGVEES